MTNALTKTDGWKKMLHSTGSKYHLVTKGMEDLAWAREKEFAVAIMNQSHRLQEATPESLGQAMLQAASMGLTLNPLLGYCYLIPRKARRRKAGESDRDYAMVPVIAYASPSYKGLSHVCERSGNFLVPPRAEVVFAADHFVYKGPVEKPDHVPTRKPAERVEPKATEVYAVAKLRGGDWVCEMLDRATVQKIRQMSDQPNSIMWNPQKLWTEGWKKAVIRRFVKTLPKAPAIDAAISQLNEFEGSLPEPEESGEPEVCVGELELMKLHAMLTDNGIEPGRANEWLDRLARRFGVNEIRDLPMSKLDKAEAALRDALRGRA